MVILNIVFISAIQAEYSMAQLTVWTTRENL